MKNNCVWKLNDNDNFIVSIIDLYSLAYPTLARLREYAEKSLILDYVESTYTSLHLV